VVTTPEEEEIDRPLLSRPGPSPRRSLCRPRTVPPRIRNWTRTSRSCSACGRSWLRCTSSSNSQDAVSDRSLCCARSSPRSSCLWPPWV